MPAFLKNIGTVEILIIALVIILFFGGKKFSELARGLGESKLEAKKIKDEIKGKGKKKSEEEASWLLAPKK